MKKNLVVLILTFIFIQPVLAETARVTGDRVNVRAKPILGSEIVTQLSLNEEVLVVEETDEWAKIKGPVHSKCWVHSDYVKDGVITANGVNMRCGPGVAFPSLVKVNKNTKVNVIDESGDWVRVSPPVEFTVWVSSKYLEYEGSVDKEAEEKIVKVVEEETSKEEPIETEEEMEFVEVSVVPGTISVSEDEIAGVKLKSYIGTLEDLGVIINRPGTYKLVARGKWVCILKSPTLDLNPYVNRVIRIEGVEISESSSWGVPVAEVKRLQVVR